MQMTRVKRPNTIELRLHHLHHHNQRCPRYLTGIPSYEGAKQMALNDANSRGRSLKTLSRDLV